MTERANIRDRVNPAEWETFRRCKFVRKTFHPYPCITSIGPLDEGVARVWTRYRGQPYDPSRFELVEAGWDHEHCNVCNARVEEGQVYWSNDGPEHVDLCSVCYPLVEGELSCLSKITCLARACFDLVSSRSRRKVRQVILTSRLKAEHRRG